MAVSKRLRFEILRRDNHTCRYCGRSAPEVKLTIDHVVPETLGGKTEATNLVTACQDCNAGKSSVPPGAPLVANVERDAIRWAQAIKVAAASMVEEMWAAEQRNQAFLATWNHWVFGPRHEPVPLPNDWPETVQRFRTAGLADDLIARAVRIAMEAPSVALDNTFRYFCGVCWRMIGDLHDRARAIVETSPGREV